MREWIERQKRDRIKIVEKLMIRGKTKNNVKENKCGKEWETEDTGIFNVKRWKTKGENTELWKKGKGSWGQKSEGRKEKGEYVNRRKKWTKQIL